MSKFVNSLLSSLAKPAVQSQVVATAVALVSAFGFHLPATDVAMIVSGAVGLVSALGHVQAKALGDKNLAEWRTAFDEYKRVNSDSRA